MGAAVEGEEMKLGIHHNVPMADYLRLPYLSSSLVTTLNSYSPLHAKYAIDNRSDESPDVANIGSAFHSLLLEGDDVIAVIDAKDWRTNAAKEARDAAIAAGKIPLLPNAVNRVRAMVSAATSYIAASQIAGIFDSGAPEQTIIWQEGEILCRARPDWWTDNHRMMLHLKSTDGSANPDQWVRRQLVPMGYDTAAAFYARGGFAVDQSPDEIEQVFLVVEQNPPYGCSLVGMDAANQDIAARKVQRAIDLWQECQKSGKYPCYSTNIYCAEATPWALAEAEKMFSEDELNGGIPA